MVEETDLRAPQVSIRRIMWGGTIWFAAMLLSVALMLGLLLNARWRPTEMPPVLDGLWWLGAAAVVLGLFMVGWAGCPVLEKTTAEENASKVRWMPPGVVLFLSGSAVTLIAVLLGPVH